MTVDVPIEPCFACGTRKRIDTWCDAPACMSRVAAALADHRAWISAALSSSPDEEDAK